MKKIEDKTPTRLRREDIYSSNKDTYEYINRVQELNDTVSELPEDSIFKWFGHIGDRFYFYYNAFTQFYRGSSKETKTRDYRIIRYLKDGAKNDKEGYTYHLVLSELYLKGDTENGVIRDVNLAQFYLEVAAERGSLLAKFNLAIVLRDEEPERALELFNELIDYNYALGYLGLGSMYYKGIGVEKNYTESLMYFEKAFIEVENEASSFMAYIYNKPEMYNETLTDIYLSIALGKESDMRAKLLAIDLTYQNKHNFTEDIVCNQVLHSIAGLLKYNEMQEFYKLGYRKYTMGDFDSALMYFSFAAMHGKSI